MGVSVQDQFGTLACYHGAELGAVEQLFMTGCRPWQWRGMDKDYPTAAALLRARQKGCKPRHLIRADPAGSAMGWHGGGTGDSDDGKRSARAQIGKIAKAGGRVLAPVASLARHVVSPKAQRTLPGNPHIGIVIAGDHADVLRPSQLLQPGCGTNEFYGQRYLHQ